MSYTGGARLVPLANGGLQLVGGDGVALVSISSTGAMTFGAAATVAAMRIQNMTGAERDALGSPAAGMLIYNTTTNKLNVRAAAAWEAVTSA